MRYSVTVKNTTETSEHMQEIIRDGLNGVVAHIDTSENYTTLAFYAHDTDTYVKVHNLLTNGIVVGYGVSNE